MDAMVGHAVDFLSGRSPYSAELQSFWMAMQGAMLVRKGPNKERKLHWFHAFSLSVMAAFAGGVFGPLPMGKPSAMLASDFGMGACLLVFFIVNCIPFDIGFRLCNTLPVGIIIVSFAQLFRSTALCKYVVVCYEAFKDSPSKYYPIPVFGPILHATMLGNMGGFVMKGFEGHVKNGMPWPVQNGLFCASFFHFFVHDKTGPIGTTLRQSMRSLTDQFDLDDHTFALCFVSLFMQIMGILQMPVFLGPSFSPFMATDILSPWKDSKTWSVGKSDSNSLKKQEAARAAPSPRELASTKSKEVAFEPKMDEPDKVSKDSEQISNATASKKKRKRKKKKKTE